MQLPHSSKVEGTAVEAWITPALSIHMDPSSVGFFYCSKKQVSTESLTDKGKMKQQGTEILEIKPSWHRHKVSCLM